MTLKVGITGGIGSGKTTVCGVIETLGYPVYYADIEAKRITETDCQVIAAISKIFGDDIYISGKLDRKRLAAIVFSNKDLLHKLNGIIHPAVAMHFSMWVSSHSTFPVVFEETAILFESGAKNNLDQVIGVIAPTNLRVERVVKRDNTNVESVINRMNNQLDNDELKKRCDYIVYNDETRLVLPQILKLLENIAGIK